MAQGDWTNMEHFQETSGKHTTAGKYKNTSQRPAQQHTIKQQHTWSQVQQHAHKPTRTHTHTLLSACEKLRGDGCLFVCLRCCFWCVCDTTRPCSLPLRPLIPPVEMKCNGADSIRRVLPPREMQRIKSHQIPVRLPSIRCCLVDGREIKQWWLIHLALCALTLTHKGESVSQ